MATNVAVVQFPGSNCDRDCVHALNTIDGVTAEIVWHKSGTLGDVDAVVLPGGFSYGDYLRPGAVAGRSPIVDEVIRFARAGAPVIGICNGFQVLTESGLLPGALLQNRTLRFVCRDVHLRVETSRCTWSGQMRVGQVLSMPVAHGDGAYFIDEDGYAELREHDQVVLTYCRPDGCPGANINGAVHDIAGICNRAGNVLGMMPHPERASEAILGSTDGRAIFDALSA